MRGYAHPKSGYNCIPSMLHGHWYVSSYIIITRTYVFLDSLVMSQSKELEEMVKPEMRENWEEEKKKWFVLDDSIDQQREPGKF